MTLLRATATIGGLTFISRILGFIRDMMIAATLGAGVLSDAFFVAFKIPNFMRRLFAEGAFNVAFVPMFAGMVVGEGKSAARQFAEEVYNVLLWILIGVTILFMLAMPWVMVALAPGFDEDPTKFNLSVELTRITMPYILFISLVSLMGGILNSFDKFAAVAATPVIMNLCLIFAMLALVQVSETPAHALAWGVLLSGAAQFLWLYWFCKKSDVMPTLKTPVITTQVKKLLTLILPVAFGSSVMQINLMIDMMIASTIPNAVSYLYYADRLNELPLGVIGIAIATALLPMMSRQIREGKLDAARYSQNRAMELAMLLGLPAVAAFIVLAYPLISVMFQRGAFGITETEATYKALMAYAFGIPAFLMIKIFAPGFFANQDTKTPVKIALVCMILNVILNLTLIQFFSHVGMAMSSSITGWINALTMGYILYRREVFKPDAQLIFRTTRILLASIIMAVVVHLIYQHTAQHFLASSLERYLSMGLLVCAGVFVYGISILALRVVNREQIRSYFKRSK